MVRYAMPKSTGMKRTASGRKVSRSNGSSRKTAKPHFVVCLDNSDYSESLEVGKLYPKLEDKAASAHGYVRVVDESGEDYLYEADRFAELSVPKNVSDILLADR